MRNGRPRMTATELEARGSRYARDRRAQERAALGDGEQGESGWHQGGASADDISWLSDRDRRELGAVVRKLERVGVDAEEFDRFSLALYTVAFFDGARAGRRLGKLAPRAFRLGVHAEVVKELVKQLKLEESSDGK